MANSIVHARDPDSRSRRSKHTSSGQLRCSLARDLWSVVGSVRLDFGSLCGIAVRSAILPLRTPMDAVMRKVEADRMSSTLNSYSSLLLEADGSLSSTLSSSKSEREVGQWTVVIGASPVLEQC